MTHDFEARARALVGSPFRLQGRSEQGLDCVGVAISAYGVPADRVRRNYRMRGNHAAEIRETLERHFRRVPTAQLRPGDLMLMRVSADQLHIGIRTCAGFVHAHAGLRRVVETPAMPDWPLLGVYRRRRH